MGDFSTMAATYGPGFLALMLLLQFLNSFLPKVMGSNKPEETQRELARSVEKLAMVLDRMERNQEKALDEVKETANKTLMLLQKVDYCTEAVRQKVLAEPAVVRNPN